MQRRKQADLWNTLYATDHLVYAPIVWWSREKFHFQRKIQSFECVDTDYCSDESEGGLNKFVFIS